MSVDAQTIKAVFLAALDKAMPADRAAYLHEACAGDAALRRRVEALLATHDQPDALLDQPAAQHLAAELDTAALDFLEPSTRPGSLGRLGHYEVLEAVGRGSTGVVMRALDDKLHRVVAIKALAPALAGNGAARQRFVREARAAAAVTHDNVISIHAVEDNGPIPYLVMQFIDGCTLQEKLDRSGPLPVKEVLRIGLQVAEGLAAAHRQGLVHRDIKPANILLENGIERVKITDFGLARTVDDASLTHSGYIAGTPAYMSPEQANGERLDHRSDLFSLGSVLYTLCAGHPPFRAETTMAVLKRVCDETPRSLREINPDFPVWLQALIARLQAKIPAERFASADEVAELFGRRLAQLQTNGVFSDGDDAVTTRVRPEPKRTNRLPTAGNLFGAALLLVAVLAAGWFVYQSWIAGRHEANKGGPETGGPETSGSGPAAAQPVVLKPSHTLMQHTGGVRTLALSRDGKVLASGGFDRNIFLWDTKTWVARGPLEGHSGDVTGLDFSPDGTRLASVTSANDACLIRVWNVEKGKQIATLGNAGQGMWHVAYSPDGQTLACGGWDKELHILDAETGVERLLIPGVGTRHLRTLSFSPDGQQIATGGSGPTRLWNTSNGQEIPTQVRLPEGMCPTILPGGKALAGWNFGDGRVSVCDLPSGELRGAWRAHPKTIEGLAVSPDGRFLATIGGEGVARVWSTADFAEVATLIGHQGPIHSAVFIRDGARLATGGLDDRSIRIWDLPAVCRVAR